jgi:outer membrane immunogenic protein
MKKILLATAAVLITAAAASAADLAARPYTKAPPPLPPEPIYNWTGFYIGGNVGYTASDRNSVTTQGQVAANAATVAAGLRNPLVNIGRDGFIGGGQFGYNWQVSPSWVLGLEADIQYVDTRTTFTTVGTSGLSNTFRAGLDYLGTARGRLGYTWARRCFTPRAV